MTSQKVYAFVNSPRVAILGITEGKIEANQLNAGITQSLQKSCLPAKKLARPFKKPRKYSIRLQLLPSFQEVEKVIVLNMHEMQK